MPMQAQTAGGGVALTYLQPFTRRRNSRRVVSTMTWLLYPHEGLGTNCTGGWVDLRACLDDT